MEQMSKRVLKSRWREGISSYYLHLYDKGVLPKNIGTNFYYFLLNLNKPSSQINYTPIVLRNSYDDMISDCGLCYKDILPSDDNLEESLTLKIDLEDDTLIDFLINNKNNEKWIKIYSIFHQKKIELDLFEEVIFDYVFKQGLSIRKIAELTNNSTQWVYMYRKSLIDKIKKMINEDSKDV